MFTLGDVVKFYSPQAGKVKFHICICEANDLPCHFLFINSGKGYLGDLVFEDGAIPGLPNSPTGETVVSFSQVVRIADHRLRLFRAEKVSEIDAHVAGDMLSFAKSTRVMPKIDRDIVLAGLQAIIERGA